MTETPGNEHLKHHENATPVIAGAIAGFICLVTFILAFLIYRRRVRSVTVEALNNVEHAISPWDDTAITSSCVSGPHPPKLLPLVSQEVPSAGNFSRLNPSLQPASATDALIEPGTTTFSPDIVAQPDNEDNPPSVDGICVTYAQEEGFADREDEEPGENFIPSADPQASPSSGMRRRIETLQMEMARLTSAMREVMLEVEVGGSRGPPPAYEEEAD